MKTTFVNLKSEVTAAKDAAERWGFEVYRTRMNCNCAPGQNRRDGILMTGSGLVLGCVIRCKACAGVETMQCLVSTQKWLQKGGQQ